MRPARSRRSRSGRGGRNAMPRLSITLVLAVVALASASGVRLSAAKTEIRAERDPAFSFEGLKAWAWHPDGAGDVRQAISADTDPVAIARRVDPVILPAVERELQAHGFIKAADRADLYVHYYVLATVNQM